MPAQIKLLGESKNSVQKEIKNDPDVKIYEESNNSVQEVPVEDANKAAINPANEAIHSNTIAMQDLAENTSNGMKIQAYWDNPKNYIALCDYYKNGAKLKGHPGGGRDEARHQREGPGEVKGSNAIAHVMPLYVLL